VEWISKDLLEGWIKPDWVVGALHCMNYKAYDTANYVVIINVIIEIIYLWHRESKGNLVVKLCLRETKRSLREILRIEIELLESDYQENSLKDLSRSQ
jgi:hypothetical protein